LIDQEKEVSGTLPTPQIDLVHKLFMKHTGELRGFILALLPDLVLVDDLLHEVFLIATEKAANYQDGTNYLAWVKAMARFKVLEAIRLRRSTVETLSPEVLEVLFVAAPDIEADEVQVHAIRSCIQNLSKSSKTLIDMRYRLECKPAEIANRIGWTVQSVSVELSKARDVLRKCLQRKLGIMGFSVPGK
jgi:RNA polymerase sigma-70 factor (ECF subfamily)